MSPDDTPPRKPTGRPRIYDEPATERIYLLATPAQRLELRRIASDNGVSLAGLLRDAVTEYAAAYREQHHNGRQR